ncbi:MAG TPA: DUF357 domain-containing protein [Methanocorpusculum sp.]|nr:DUF357 domain-containing protein [Methanocorpusculum sp.]
MLIDNLLSLYRNCASSARSLMPAGSLLDKTSSEILEMVTCYAGDANVFFERGDLVNAFAASAYGFGWLDAGVYLGYISAEETPEIVLEKKFPSELQEKLEEKTLRYQRMLTEALAAVSPAPDAACGIYAAVKMILHETEKGLREGAAFLPDDYVNSLVEFSYGYGWLDCGVRSGLFSIHGNRHLFTI